MLQIHIAAWERCFAGRARLFLFKDLLHGGLGLGAALVARACVGHQRLAALDGALQLQPRHRHIQRLQLIHPRRCLVRTPCMQPHEMSTPLENWSQHCDNAAVSSAALTSADKINKKVVRSFNTGRHPQIHFQPRDERCNSLLHNPGQQTFCEQPLR